MGSIPRELLASMVIGLALLGVSGLVNRGPGGAPTGFPLVYSRPILGCQNLNPGNGCGYSYDVTSVVLDYLFWFIIAFAGVSVFDITRSQLARRGLRRVFNFLI